MKIKCVDIGARIRREVEAQHWTYSEFAQAINCSRSSLYNIFNSTDISLQRLLLICKVLNIDLIGEIYSFNFEDWQISLKKNPCISIPLVNGSFDLSNIPYPILRLLKAEIDADPRLSVDNLDGV